MSNGTEAGNRRKQAVLVQKDKREVFCNALSKICLLAFVFLKTDIAGQRSQLGRKVARKTNLQQNTNTNRNNHQSYTTFGGRHSPFIFSSSCIKKAPIQGEIIHWGL